MNILVCCEESQAVCIAFRERGHIAFSCDIQECSGGHPEWHIQCDVLPLINGDCNFTTCDGEEHHQRGEWDMLIAFPPCTYLSNAGAVRLYDRPNFINQARYQKGLAGKAFFLRFYNAKCKKLRLKIRLHLLCSIFRRIRKLCSRMNMDIHIAKKLVYG